MPVKSAEQQAAATILRVRELLMKQQTQLTNAMRGHASEFGVIVGEGIGNAPALVERVQADAGVPEAAQEPAAA